MAKSISCNCGWHEHGTDEELVDAFIPARAGRAREESLPGAGGVAHPGGMRSLHARHVSQLNVGGGE